MLFSSKREQLSFLEDCRCDRFLLLLRSDALVRHSAVTDILKS